MSQSEARKGRRGQDLQQRLQSTSAVVILTDYRGLSVSEIGALRARLREASIEYRVTKNTLLSRAAEQAGVSGLEPYLVGPTAVVFGHDDPGAPARILQEFIRQYRKLEIKGGVVEGQDAGSRGGPVLATLPTKRELLAKLLGDDAGADARSGHRADRAAARAGDGVLEALRKQREAASPAEAASRVGTRRGRGRARPRRRRQPARPPPPAPADAAAPVDAAGPAEVGRRRRSGAGEDPARRRTGDVKNSVTGKPVAGGDRNGSN